MQTSVHLEIPIANSEWHRRVDEFQILGCDDCWFLADFQRNIRKTSYYSDNGTAVWRRATAKSYWEAALYWTLHRHLSLWGNASNSTVRFEHLYLRRAPKFAHCLPAKNRMLNQAMTILERDSMRVRRVDLCRPTGVQVRQAFHLPTFVIRKARISTDMGATIRYVFAT
jgi:hypothetical protein